MKGFGEFLIRVSAFVRKEIVETLRQPRLVLILILGPFLILLIFGAGYVNAPRIFRTLIVVPEGSQIKDEIDNLTARMGGSIKLEGIVSSEEEATKKLQDGDVDLVFVTPRDPLGDIQQSEHPLFEVYHHEIDPLEQVFVNSLEQILVKSMNQQALTEALDRAKDASRAVQDKVEDAQVDAAATRQDLERGNGHAALRDATALAQDLQRINLALASSLSLMEGMQSLSGEEDPADSSTERLDDIARLMDPLLAMDPDEQDFAAEIAQVSEIERELAEIDADLTKFTRIDSAVMARPFDGRTVRLTKAKLGPIDYYIPGVIALLLQHVAITLGALSLVRERVGGSIELFRAAPVSAFETLLGKYISFGLLAIVLAAILTGLVMFGLHVPMLGSWTGFALVVVLLVFASLSAGFAISAISQTDTQAVQYSMIVLLASIFFSGFFMALHLFAKAVHVVSWLLPATYGTRLLQEVMLRGRTPEPLLLVGLFGLGLALFAFAWWRLHVAMARE